MQSTDLVVWASWLLGTAAFVACLALVWWGLFGDRARGRRRCPRCWYDLSHTAGLQCPECGHVASGERALRRTRRRLLPAVLAALVASFGASWALERAQTRGWESMLPTRVLMLGLPLLGAHGELTVELGNRVNRGALSDEQFRDLVDRCIAGDFRAKPVSIEWESKYGGLLRVLASSAPGALDVETRMLDLPARIDVGTDRAWPRGVPLCLDLDVAHWWPDGTACRVLVTPRWDDGARPIRILRHDTGRRRYSRPFPLVVEPPPGRAPRLDFTIALERLLDARNAEWEQIQEETVSVAVEFDDAAEPLRPFRDEAFDEAMRRAFADGVVKWAGGMSPVRVRFNRDQTRYLATETGIGVHVEVLRDDTLARRLDLWWPATPTPGGNVGWLVTYEDTDLVTEANSRDGRWSMRVTGDPALAHRAGPVEAYWAGAFTVPLLVNEVAGDAPPKDWWLETKPLVESELRVE